MSLFKCKMCGGDLEIIEGSSIAECESCGTKQTVPKAVDENLQNLFNRANTLRIKSEFDKAERLYEKIIQSDATQSEAYWGLILCKYGIEYVDDPVTLKKVPTCHRASYDSIIADDDYKSAIENADTNQRSIYQEQAREIDRIQKDILALAQKEESYDVFICYKETDANGSRTQDSAISNDIYYQLTKEGFKVFYAAITLEGKLGSAYEPIIFAALNSAKVMLVIGTKPEYFNAVWVKNEWSRYLKIIKQDRSKLLIPCYRDMDAYELPEEFAHLQAQDMSKIGFINDVVRGIQKVVDKDKPKSTVSYAEKSDCYNVRLISYGDDKLACIKLVHETLGLSLWEARSLLNDTNPILAKDVSIYEANRIKALFSKNGFDVSVEASSRVKQPIEILTPNNEAVQPLLKRVMLFLEDSDWNKADEYCEKVLDIDPECAEAYLGKMMINLKVTNRDKLADCKDPFDNNPNYKKILRFGNEKLSSEMIGYIEQIKTRNRNAQMEEIYISANKKWFPQLPDMVKIHTKRQQNYLSL